MRKVLVLGCLMLLGVLAIAQTPDPTKIPHYFGPYPNWANSPLTTVDANIQITDTCGGGAGTGATAVASVDATGAITAITVTSQGTGYTCVPDVTITSTNGTGAAAHATFAANSGYISSITLVNGGSNYFAPVVTISGNGTGATADATIDPYSGAITGITLTNAGSGYTSASISISDSGGTGTGAMATATVSTAAIAIVVDAAGTGYRTPGGLRKFVDTLPGLGAGSANNLGQYVSVAHPDTITYPGSDYYEIAVVEYSRKLHSDLPPTKLRGYVQLNYGTDASGINTIAPDAQAQFLGATIVAGKDRPVRILFRNKLPIGEAGNLFLPVDTTIMGAGMGPDMGGTRETDSSNVYDGVRNPMCGMTGAKPMGCYTDNRATLHLHGGNTPWISDGTPHQWTAPAGETTMYPKGVSSSSVPDMWYDSTGMTIAACAGQNSCAVPGATNDPGQGSLTFYYTNQQSARLLFYHDHAWGITRLNVYAGEAAGYLITDNTEQTLTAPGGPLDAADPALGLGTPLVIQDRTFVPSAAQLAIQDPTWDAARWGVEGDFWYHHVYMPAQNPADPTGVSPYGRWMYGPWFWPPANIATTPYQPIPNPYYNPACDPATAPNGFCEPPMIPGTPNISVGMEQFNDTPLVNGTAYPSMTVEPKPYRFRLLNAANDRFFNLQWYVADASGTEVALKASEVAAAQVDPNVFPTPDTTISPAGPSWLQIGTEGGFLPTPVIVPNQTITWITDPTRFDFGNVDQHSMLIAPAERTDVIVDFSKFAGKTLILYNDAPAAFPARQASYDYYTGDPDNTDIGGAPTTVPGYGPNTRTIMQVKVGNTVSKASAFSLSKLVTAFAHNANGTGVFESGQNPIIVGQAGYNRAYGTTFTTVGDCSKPGTTTKCDGFARINQQGGDQFTFDTLSGNKLAIPLQPKAMHDEMNSSTFDEYGRMTANLGVEAVPANAGAQNVVLYPYVNPATEMIDGTNLPVEASGIKATPISTASDGTQIWKITHNGVDTHPIHFHLYDVQVLNRVTWDNIILPPDMTELGWKDTVRISPLEDTLVALRPILPNLPFQIPNSIRPLNPGMPIGSMMGLSSIGPDGNATASTVVNDIVNFGWEYVWHCHILSHEEMDMMRPMSLAVPPSTPANLVATPSGGEVLLTWTDTSLNSTGFTVERATDSAFTAPENVCNVNVTNCTDSTAGGSTYFYRVKATNTVGSTKDSGFNRSPGGNSMPTMTVSSGYAYAGSLALSISPASGPQGTAVDVTFSGSALTGTTAVNVSGLGVTVSNVIVVNDSTVTATLTIAPDAIIGTRTVTLTTPNGTTAPVSFAVIRMPAPTLSSISPASGIRGTTVPVTLTGTNLAYVTSILAGTGITVSGITPVSSTQLDATFTVGSNAGGSVTTVTVTSAGGTSNGVTFTIPSPVLSVTPPAVSFGTQLVPTSSTAQVVTISNTGTQPLSITSLGVSGTNSTEFAYTHNCGATFPISLAAGASCTASFTFTPLAAGLRTGSFDVTVASPALSQSVPLSGTGNSPGAVLSTTSLAFASQLVNTASSAQSVTITNNGTAPLTFSTISFSGANPGDFTSGGTCGTTLAINSSCTIQVTFTPLARGPRTATLVVTDNAASSPQSVAVSGTGIAPVAVVLPPAIAFGTLVNATASAPQTLIISNTGDATLLINNINIGGPNGSDFGMNIGTCGIPVGPLAACSVSVTFTPASAGAKSATLTIATSDPVNPILSVPLTGTGTAVSLSPAVVAFGNQTVGTSSASHSITISNAGTTTLTINSISLTGTDPAQYTLNSQCGTQIATGRSCSVLVRFAPTSTAVANASVTFTTSDPGLPVASVPLSGTGTTPVLSANPTSLTFSSTLNTTSTAQTITVTNTGVSALTINNISLGGTNLGQFRQTNNCNFGTPLANGAGCTINVTFRPTITTPTTLSQTLTINVAAPATSATIPLTGTVILPTYSVDPTTVSFPNQAIGTTSNAQTVTILNTGTVPLPISNIVLGGTNSNQFTQTHTCGANRFRPFPSTLAVGASCTISTTFRPTTATSSTATITLSVGGGATPAQTPITLSGTGQ